MTNDEGMTKSEVRDARSEDLFWDDGAGLVREEPEARRVYDLEERTARFGEAIIEAGCLRHSGFIILSAFGIRISSFSRL